MKAICCAGIIVVGAALANPAGAGEIWRNDFVVSAPPTLDAFVPSAGPLKPAAAVAFADDGDVVYGALAPNALDVEVVRVRADGSVRWSFAFDTTVAIAALLADADGGATIAYADSEDDDRANRIVHVGADGQLSWSRTLPSGWLARVSTGRIASAGRSRLSVLDTSTGDVIWQRVLSRASYGDAGGLVVDAASNLYVSAPSGDSAFRTLKYDADGTLLWSATTTDSDRGGVVAVGTGTLYVRAGFDVRALDVADGNVAWSSFVGDAAIVRLSADSSAEPIVATASGITRLVAGDGTTRWNKPLADILGIDVLDDALLVATSSRRARLDPDNGAIVWSAVYGDGPRLPLGVGARSGNEARAIARPAATAPGIARAIDERIDLANGATVASTDVAAIDHGVDATSVLDADGRVLDAGASQHPDGPRLQLRAIDGASGTELWRTNDAIPPPGNAFAPALSRARPAVASGGDVFAVVQVLGDGGLCASNAAWTRVAAYARADGTGRWVSWLRDADALYCPYASEPVVDATGNTFVSIVTLVSCPVAPSLGCQRRTLYKLAAADGAVLWRHDEAVDAGIEGLVLSPAPLTLVDGDVVLAGGFLDAPATALRVAGADGSIVWGSHVFDGLLPGDTLDRLGDGSLVAYGGTDSSYSWARLDVATGNATWTNTVSWVPCYDAGCNGYGASLILPGGDKIVPFQRDYAPWLKRQHNDGSGTVDEWMLGESSPILSSSVSQVLRDPDGQLHVYLRHRHRFTGSATFLAALDAQGALLGQQAVYAYDGDLTDASSYPAPLAMPAANRLLAHTVATRLPSPTTAGVALYDTSVTAHGNLALTLDTDRTQVAADMPLAFHLHVTYAGDAPIAGARLVANLPWASGITGASCTVQSGGNCTLDTRTGNVRATFDLAPGGTVDVSGSVRVLDVDRETPAITATTYGPTGLAESDTIDNFARVDVLQSLFIDGFDAD